MAGAQGVSMSLSGGEFADRWASVEQMRQVTKVRARRAVRSHIEKQSTAWSEGVFAIHELPVGTDVPKTKIVESGEEFEARGRRTRAIGRPDVSS